MDGASLSPRLIENDKGDRYLDALTSGYVPYTAQAGRLCSPFPIHLSHLQLLHSSHWFQEIKKSALGFFTHGKAHMVKPSEDGLYGKSGVAQVLNRYYDKACILLGGFKFPHSNWHENIEKYVCSLPT
jgi:hypothetical protein